MMLIKLKHALCPLAAVSLFALPPLAAGQAAAAAAGANKVKQPALQQYESKQQDLQQPELNQLAFNQQTSKPSAPNQPALNQQQLKQQWEDYFSHSASLARQDRRQMQRELKIAGKKKPVPPPAARAFGFDPDQPRDFYLTEEGRRITDIILSYQTPSGGWSKRIDMSQAPRRKGQGFGLKKNYTPTFDNKATTTQMQVLARAYQATGKADYKEGFLRGLALLMQAQFPNGGWPQSFPLDGGYHDYITYNDKTMSLILELLRQVADGDGDYGFVPQAQRQQALASFLKGINCILMTQVNVNGKFTIWAAQYDPFTLQPRPARAFEPAALASQESVAVVRLLMKLKDPPAVVVQAIEDAMVWFEASQLQDLVWDKKTGALKQKPGAGPLWARFYDIPGNRPVFGDRDGKTYVDISQVSEERRLGYAWYSTAPGRLFSQYEKWRAAVNQ